MYTDAFASSASPCHSPRTLVKSRFAPKYCTSSSGSRYSCRPTSHAAAVPANESSHAFACACADGSAP